MTGYGEYITVEILREIVGAGITPVAGFMEGIDLLVHETALSAGCCSVAVAAGGLDRPIPPESREILTSLIDRGGLLISPYEEGAFPYPGRFHRRNRVIAGLSPVLLVPEAGKTSGALLVAGAAERSGRTVMAVPGPLTSSRSLGTASLIAGGAKIVTCAADILEEYGLERPLESRGDGAGLTERQRSILDLVADRPLTADELTRQLKISVRETGIELTSMCLKKLLIRKEGKYVKGNDHAH